ncbi:MAG: 4-fold beta flower protein [Candidatus Woesearchaeota archaeon]
MIKKNIFIGFLLLFLFLTLFNGNSVLQAEEITLYNYEGGPVAYIAVEEDFTIYLWNGEPVAYLYEKSNNINVYSFNGDHLGWFENGIIIDHDGNAVGFIEGALNIPTKFEPYKSIKKIKPTKSIKKTPPIKPSLSEKWSSVPLQVFLTFRKAEPAVLAKNIDNGDQIIILRTNGEAWLLDAITWCNWAWKYEGSQVWINFGSLKTEIMNNDGQLTEFWTKNKIDY